MTWPVHAAAAILVSRFNPILGGVLAFFSHPVIDMTMLEYQVDFRQGKKLKTYILPYIFWILWWLAACVILWNNAPLMGKICILLGLSPDIIEIFHIVWGWARGKDYWGKGDNLLPWHDTTVQKPSLPLWATVLIEVLFVAGALFFLKPGWMMALLH